jgi:SAM-dependent methyltransferase
VNDNEVLAYNRRAWNRQVEQENCWTIPVTHEQVEAARRGEWSIFLTPLIPVPRGWFPPAGAEILCLASGGGQQGPLLAAAGYRVTVFDLSDAQLNRDREVAEREGLNIRLVQGDMRDLSAFADESFDTIVHPVSNCFCPEVRPVWREAYRVLRRRGSLLAGFNNPAVYLFDTTALWEQRRLEVRWKIPYDDLHGLSEEEKQKYREKGIPLEFSHTYDELIGGQLEAGCALTGFYEDRNPPGEDVLSEYLPWYFATRAVKLN